MQYKRCAPVYHEMVFWLSSLVLVTKVYIEKGKILWIVIMIDDNLEKKFFKLKIRDLARNQKFDRANSDFKSVVTFQQFTCEFRKSNFVYFIAPKK